MAYQCSLKLQDRMDKLISWWEQEWQMDEQNLQKKEKMIKFDHESIHITF